LLATYHAIATRSAATAPSSQKWLPVTTTTYDVNTACNVAGMRAGHQRVLHAAMANSTAQPTWMDGIADK